MVKEVGRVSDIYDLRIDKNGMKIIVEEESITLHYNKKLELVKQKQKISIVS